MSNRSLDCVEGEEGVDVVNSVQGVDNTNLLVNGAVVSNQSLD